MKKRKRLKRTRQEAIRACRRLWKELAKHGHEYKDSTEAFEKDKILDDYNECPLCQYVLDLTGLSPAVHEVTNSLCEQHCPLSWPGGTCFTGKALFHAWYAGKGPGERGEVARAIYELPTKPYKLWRPDEL